MRGRTFAAPWRWNGRVCRMPPRSMRASSAPRARNGNGTTAFGGSRSNQFLSLPLARGNRAVGEAANQPLTERRQRQHCRRMDQVLRLSDHSLAAEAEAFPTQAGRHAVVTGEGHGHQAAGLWPMQAEGMAAVWGVTA